MSFPVYIRSLLRSERAIVLIDQLVTSAGSFFTTIILARLLGINDFGVYSSIVLFMYLLLSISNALVIGPFQVLQAGHDDLRSYISSLLFWQLVICLLLILLSIPVAFLNIPFLSAIRPYFVPSLLLIATFLLQDFLRRVLLATGKARQALIIDLVSVAPQIFLLLVRPVNLEYALWVMSGTCLLPVIIGAYYIHPILPSRKLLTETFHLQFNNGKWLLLTAVLQWCAGNLFVVASGMFLGMKALGALRLAQTLFGVLNVLLQVFENHVLPVASRLHKESTTLFQQYLWNTTRKSTLLMLPVSSCLFIFAPQVFKLSGGSAYTDYAFALQGMAVLYFFIFAGYSSRLAIRVLMLNRDFFIGYVLSFVFSLLASRFFIQQWDLRGVIAGLIINQLLLQAYWHYILIRKNFILWAH